MINPYSRFLLLVIIAIHSVVATADPIKVQLISNTLNVEESQVTVGTVARITGASSAVKKRIQSLDLDQVAQGASTTILKAQIEVRLQLAGFSTKEFVVTGPNSIAVRQIKTSSKNLLANIENKIELELARQFGLPPDDVQIRIRDEAPLTPIRERLQLDDLSVMAVFPNRLPLGERTIPIEFSDNLGKRLTAKLSLRIVILRDVFITAGNIPQGTVIQASHIQSVKRPIVDNNLEIADSDCIGCVASRDIPMHEILSSRWIREKPAAAKARIKANDVVDVVLERGKNENSCQKRKGTFVRNGRPSHSSP